LKNKKSWSTEAGTTHNNSKINPSVDSQSSSSLMTTHAQYAKLGLKPDENRFGTKNVTLTVAI
jgi:hypothetical protein